MDKRRFENHFTKRTFKKHLFSNLSNKLNRAYHKIARDVSDANSRQMQKKFLRKSWQKQNEKSWWQRSRFMNSKAVKKIELTLKKSILFSNIRTGHNVEYSQNRLLELAAKEVSNSDLFAQKKSRN